MQYRLRQICLVARHIEPVLADLQAVFGIDVAARDLGVAKYGLGNAVMPVGHAFLEVVSPQREGTTAGRYLERLGGDGGYMVLLDGTGFDAKRAHLERLGARIAHVRDGADDPYRTLHLHPRDVGATLLSIDEQRGGAQPDGAWLPAGPHWQQHVRTDVVTGLAGVALQSPGPEALARRWGRLLDRPVHASPGDTGHWHIDLDDLDGNARLRFVPATDDRGETMQGIDIRVASPGVVQARARARGLRVDADQVHMAGMVFNLVH